MFTVTIRTDSAAFEDDALPEVVRILREAIHKVSAGATSARLLDVNGNTVGAFTLTED